MLQKQDKSQDYNPVDETDLDSFDAHIVFYVHDFLQFFVAFTHLAPRVLNVEVDSVKHGTLLDN